jgi:hypothetical protein
MDIGGWLHCLGLEEYEAAFRANKVNAARATMSTQRNKKRQSLVAPHCQSRR